MENLKQLIIILMLCLAVGVSAQNTATEEEGVIINGVKWATRNLDVGGTFVENPEDYGGFYQWGRTADGHEDPASATTEILSDTDSPNHSYFIGNLYGYPYDWLSPENNALWNAGSETAPVKAMNDPSPAGWRVPTFTEIRTLFQIAKVSSVLTTENGIYGARFTDIATGSSVFFPAERWRVSDGSISNPENGSRSHSSYWSSSPCGGYFVYTIGIDSNGATYNGFIRRANGMHIRSVKDKNYSAAIGGILSDGRKITGYYNLNGIPLQTEPDSGIYIIRYDNGTAEKKLK